jgi:hypothetical protein
MSFLRKFFSGGSPPPLDHPPLPSGVDQFLPAGKAFHASTAMRGQQLHTGAIVFRSGSGSSLISQADADRQARANAERHLAAALRGARTGFDTYAYAVERQLEPLVESLSLPGTTAVAARITINTYGALIINARSAFFADVDTRPTDAAPDQPEADARAAADLRAVVERQPQLTFRTYRTRNGWRYLCTSRSFDPAADETRQLLEALGADPRYILLCRAQRCFRARLTPKPWRIGATFNQVRPSQAITRRHLERYLRESAPYASASFTADVGASTVAPPELRLVADYHDQWCSARTGKPLA